MHASLTHEMATLIKNSPFWTTVVYPRNFTIVIMKTKVYSSLHLNLNSVNQLIFVMVKCGVLFEVRTEFLNFI
jgi:hypothetical protein